MKRILLLLVVAACALAFIGPPVTGRVTLLWDYPTNELSTNLIFNIYETTNLATPVSQWNCLTNVSGTNTSVSLVIQPGEHFFFATASNFWGESIPSNIITTPPPARMIGESLKIVKE